MKNTYLLKYWKKHNALFVAGILFVLLEAVSDLFQPRIMALLIDRGALQGYMPDVIRYGAMMLGVAIMGMIFALIRNVIASHVSQRFAAELRLDLYKKIMSLPANEIDDFEEGSLITRQTNDVTILQVFVNGMMRILVKAPFICIGAIIMSATLSIRTIPIIIPIIFAVIIVMIISMKLAYPRFGKMQGALDKLNTTIRDYLIGIKLVKLFHRYQSEETRFDAANDGLAETTVGANRILVIFSPFVAFFIHLGIAMFLFLSARWIDYGELQVGQIMAFVSYMFNIMASLTIISHTMNLFVRVRTSHSRIAEVFAAESVSNIADKNDTSNNKAILSAGLSLKLDGVCFRYKNSTGHPALSDISFSLTHGETLGIIGPTGSGKSTLADLLMRFYEPTEGEILINEHPLSQISDADWRLNVSIVPQTPTLFAGTISENIAWGKMSATDDELNNAATDAQAHGFITSSPDGLARKIGRAGAGLSGGERQRVSIARALVRNPKLLVLDDCTSALDVVTEANLKKALAGYSMTKVIITQRVATARGCDKILVLNNGKMAGFGTHDELIGSCMTYRDIYQSQIGGDSVG